MAYTSGTAANYKDLLAILATFAAANGWSILEQSATRVYFKGTGLAGLDEIYCGIETYEVPASGIYNWELMGSWGWRSGRNLEAHPRSSGDDKVFLYLWNSSIPYRMVATPRRIIMVAKVSTVYQFLHLGLINPIGTDAQYPYPLLIGGCGYSKNQNYTMTGASNAAFWGNQGQAAMLSFPGGYWGYSFNIGSAGQQSFRVLSFHEGYNTNIYPALDGSYMLEPFYLVDYNRSSIYGNIDGLYRLSGYNNTPENIVTVSGVNYMVFPDVYRLTVDAFCALRMN